MTIVTLRLQFNHQLNDGLRCTYFYLCDSLGYCYEHKTVTELSQKTPKCETATEGEPVDQASIDRRLRLKNGRIARKFGNTYIRTLRARYGEGFAPGERAERQAH